MATLSYNEVEYLYRGLDHKFKHNPTRETKKETLHKQYLLRDAMVVFLMDNNREKTFTISPEDGELIKKKLEYTFKRRKCTQSLIQKLTS